MSEETRKKLETAKERAIRLKKRIEDAKEEL